MSKALVADVHVSQSQEQKTILLRRAAEKRARTGNARSAARSVCLSAGVPAFAEPDIHCLSQARMGRPRRLSLCSLPVPKQFEESLGSWISFAQSATCGTWQPARCVILLFSYGPQATAAPCFSEATKSRCARSTASRYATILRATASVARLAFPFCFSFS